TPNCPGQQLQARLTVTSNGNQRFVVPVMLNVGTSAPTRPSGLHALTQPSGVQVPIAQPWAIGTAIAADTAVDSPPLPPPTPPLPRRPWPSAVARPQAQPTLAAEALQPPPRRFRAKHLLPVLLLLLLLGGLSIKDVLTEAPTAGPLAELGAEEIEKNGKKVVQ